MFSEKNAKPDRVRMRLAIWRRPCTSGRVDPSGTETSITRWQLR